MKKFKVPRIFMAVALLLAGLSLFSCLNTDGPDIPPVKLEDLKGNYKGRLITVQGGTRTEKTIDFKVKTDTIVFAEFPVKEIVASVVKDPVKTELAIKEMGKIKYDLKYAAMVNTYNNVVELIFTPKILELKIPVDGAVKNTTVQLAAKQKGYFVGMDQSLRFAVEAEKITVDGVVLSPFETISYNFPFCVKAK
ncbi:MAG: DUF4840 domain-containing protein [Chryseobacterium sp.]|uniref:DUF4840 domain-containing protein n=1 Tax=Chryseobacterium sp. TaxID=1871047 RepID=UPI0025C65F02|nr:DUF4840 domain-containing protein [Chryseobacterium sp.]MCJ7934108.1 DUF4840 domain-containing protein [Chryseobacterium sp.]